MLHPKILEINVRLLLTRYSTKDRKATLKDIPNSYWENIAEKGIQYIWLMGIWETCDSVIEKCCFEEGLVNSYSRALKDWTKEDIIGSPYSINNYELNKSICNVDELKHFTAFLKSIELKLILDFIPNHFSVDSEILKNKPELFLQTNSEHHIQDQHTFFQSEYHENKFFAHGRDPFFPAWTDTVQLNYFNEETRKFMIENLLKIAAICDGVRCDMAMLVMNNVLKNTWRGTIENNIAANLSVEFWNEAIETVKKKNKNFIFIAEAYWDLEWQLQNCGFDFTYDKRLLDRLENAPNYSIMEHLRATKEYQERSVRFLENHDEDRAITKFGFEKSFAAAIIISTVQGMKLYFDGQFEGKKIKLPIQLGREPKELANPSVVKFYKNLFSVTNHDVFNYGEWEILYMQQAWEGNINNENIFAWKWNYKNENRLVLINYSDKTSQGRIKLDLNGYEDVFQLKDLLNNKIYTRSVEEVHHIGLFIELGGYKAHIFEY